MKLKQDRLFTILTNDGCIDKNIIHQIKDGILFDDITSAIRKYSHGNISSMTIIMLTLAMQAKERVDKRCPDCSDPVNDCDVSSSKRDCYVAEFMKLLDKKINNEFKVNMFN